MTIKSQIRELPDGEPLFTDPVGSVHECLHVATSFDSTDLKTLAGSHDKLLEAAKKVQGIVTDFDGIISEAEKL